MRYLRQILLGLLVFGGLLACGSCSEKKPVSYFLISPAAGAGEISEADRDTLCATLDAVALRCKMAKFKAGQPGIIRYYQPNRDYEIGFYAKREVTCMKVFALPMTPSVLYQDYFKTFRQDLANVLSSAFPGRVRMAQ
jgi:hypothetical protein